MFLFFWYGKVEAFLLRKHETDVTFLLQCFQMAGGCVKMKILFSFASALTFSYLCLE